MNLVTGLWGMNVHVPGQDVTSGVSTQLTRNGMTAEILIRDQYAWFGGILGCLAAFAVCGAWATVRWPDIDSNQLTTSSISVSSDSLSGKKDNLDI